MAARFMQKRFVGAVACLCLMAPVARVAAPAAGQGGPPQTALPGAEQGVFRVYADGKQIGTENFRIVRDGADWIAEGRVALDSADGKVEQTTKLLLTSDGGLRSYSWEQSSPRKASANVAYQDGKAVIEYKLDKGSDRAEYSFGTPQVTILDNNVFHHFIFLIRHYDFAKSGLQQMPIFVPQDVTPGTIAVTDRGMENVEGKKWRHLTAGTPDLEIHIWLEGERLVKITVPAANVEVVRE